jgi:hypothetical protein
VGYEKNSVIAYKAYPEHQITMQHFYNDDILATLGSYAFARKWQTSV